MYNLGMETLGVHNRFGLDENFRGPTFIEGLPDNLRAVPRGPTGTDTQLDDERRIEWHRWSIALRQYRLNRLQEIRDDPRQEHIERKRCKLDPAYFLAVYGWLYEPRKGKGRGGFNPWIPFERQVQMVRWFQCLMVADDEKADGAISKCRDVGMSWELMLLVVHSWLFEDTFSALLVSWKEVFVESRAPKSLFWKIDKLLMYLPTFLKPKGFIPSKHRIKLYLENPENGNTVTGESTTGNSGRGDRMTLAIIDEAAQVPDLLDVYSGMADSTEHRIVGSTESLENGTDFIDIRTGAESEYRPSVFTIDWYEHPLHDTDWYKFQEKRYAARPDDFRREILRDPYVASQYVYPTVRDMEPTVCIHLPGNPLYVGIDPGFDDSCALVYLQYNMAAAKYEVLNGYTNRKMLADFYVPFLTGSFIDLETGEDLSEVYSYTDYEQELIAWVAQCGFESAKFIGDMYGNNTNGASADTWYTVWQRKAGVIVNRDRLPNGKLSAARNQARTLTGRRKAVRWILPNLVFGDSVGARQAHAALGNNVFDQNNNDRIPERGMKRDGTTHYTSATEYFAANIYLQSELTKYNTERNKRQDDMYESDYGSRGSRLAQLGTYNNKLPEI